MLYYNIHVLVDSFSSIRFYWDIFVASYITTSLCTGTLVDMLLGPYNIMWLATILKIITHAEY